MRQFHDVKKFRKHGFFHRWNPFNSAIRNRLKNTLGVSVGKNLFLPPVLLDQGSNNICSEDGSYTNRSSVTGKAYIPGAYIASEQDFIGNSSTTEFDAQTVMNTAVLSGFKASDGTIDKPSAILWCHANNGMDLYDAIQFDTNLTQSPAGIASPWFSDWETGQSGIVPFSANNVLGGHWFTGCGKVKTLLNTRNVLFTEPDRLAIANTWGTSAPGSDRGYYYFSRQEVNAWFGNLGVAHWIYSNDKTIQTLGKISAMYVKILTLLHLA